MFPTQNLLLFSESPLSGYQAAFLPVSARDLATPLCPLSHSSNRSRRRKTCSHASRLRQLWSIPSTLDLACCIKLLFVWRSTSRCSGDQNILASQTLWTLLAFRASHLQKYPGLGQPGWLVPINATLPWLFPSPNLLLVSHMSPISLPRDA